MIICEFTPTGGDPIRCAMEDFANVHLWKSYIKSIASIKISMPQKWGGYAEPTFSDLSFFPDMFLDIWPPPETAAVKLRWIEDDDETGGQVIFDGTARRGDLARDEIKYHLKRPENATKVAASTAYSATLVSVMTTLCGPTLLNLSIDTTRARIPSPAVSYTTTSEQLAIDLASAVCAFFSHGFYIENGTLYLIDMYDITTTQETVTEWDVLPCAYKYDTPYSVCKCGDYSATSATVENGEELSIGTAFHTVEANIESALAIILEIANRPTVELNAMITSRAQTIGGCYVFDDDSLAMPVQSIMIAQDIVYNFDSEILQATGPGAIS